VTDSALDITLAVPTDWYGLPVGSEDAKKALDRLVASFDVTEAVTATLRIELGNINAFAQTLPRGKRRNWALVQDPGTGHANAFLTVRVYLASAEKYTEYRDALDNPPDENGGVEIVNRSVDYLTLSAGPAILTHDFSLSHGGEGLPSPATERATITLFPFDSGVAVQLMILTQDLSLFADLPSYVRGLAEAIISNESAVSN
jgi:hypothetical protein